MVAGTGRRDIPYRPAGPHRTWLVVEHLLLFYGVAGFFALVKVPGGPIPVLVVLTVGALVYLRRQPDFDRANLLRPGAVRPELPAILALWALAVVLGVAAIAVWWPAHLFDLPRQQPLVWAAVIVFYPLFSVYPQELLFRAFLLHRYAPLFGSGRAAALASAVAFGFGHLLFHNVPSVLLTLVGGWLFTRRYQQSRSLLAVGVEHALYGVAAFTIGLGTLFYHGAVR
jgi:membrane protease YdiL (CAAX protease family)